MKIYMFVQKLLSLTNAVFDQNLDTSPFKKYIHWDEYSFYVEQLQEVVEMVKSCKKDEMVAMNR